MQKSNQRRDRQIITDAMRERIFGNETVMKRVDLVTLSLILKAIDEVLEEGEINADESVSDISAGCGYDL